MGRLSIRLRLTLWNGSVLGAILAGLGLAVYLLMDRTLLARTDDVLAFEFEETVERLHAAPSRADLGDLPEAFLQAFLLRITDPGGQIRLQSSALAGVALPPGPDATAPTFHSLDLGRLGPHRVVSGATEGPGGNWRVQIATSLASRNRDLAALRNVLLTILPAGLLAAVLGGWWLAGRALAPVARMTETARQIGARNLTERIPITNPADELGHLAATLNAMIARLADALEAQRRFTADASHELMTPLTAIRTEAEVALQSPRSAAEHAKVLASVVEEVDRLTRLGRQLLFLASEDACSSPRRLHPVPLAGTVRAAVELMRAQAEQAGIEVAVGPLPTVHVRGEGERLRQAFVNLLDNAVKYNRPGGKVVVQGRCTNGQALVEVADTGIGMPPEAVPHIFERFYRVDRSRSRRTGGTGLGLSIVKTTVEGFGGTVQVESEPDRGSTFRVVLPVISPADAV
jgi:heavy metal sensor kinase